VLLDVREADEYSAGQHPAAAHATHKTYDVV
jgi:rhodanese-related sulfurtransferase